MKNLLLESKETIMRSLISESREFEAIVEDMDPKDLADVAADDIDKKTLQALNASDVRRLKLIESALSRIKNGRYGLCMRCGKKSPKKGWKQSPML